MSIQLISKEKANQIIENRTPIGLFVTEENGMFIGIDNQSGEAWVEEFDNKVDCENWLKGEADNPP